MQRTSPLQKAFNTNNTSTSFTVLTPTVTEPAGVHMGEDAAAAGIFNLVPRGRSAVPDRLWVSFFGAGADNTTFSVRLWGWERIGSNPLTTLWVPIPLLTLDCTVSTTVGVAGAKVIETDRFVDTMTLASVAPEPRFYDLDATPAATYGGTTIIFSPANQIRAWCIVPLYGCEKIQFDFDMTGATNGNAIFRGLRDNEF